LGTAQFGLPYGISNVSGRVESDEAAAILQCAHEAGIDTLDTAIAYGQSERQLGNAGVEGWRIVTKLPGIPDSCRDVAEWVTSSVNGSLKRLGVGSLHGLLLHRPQQLIGATGGTLFRALNDLKSAGVVQKIGISIYDPRELEPLWHRFRFDLIQAPFNVLDRRLVTSGWLDRLSEAGAEVHVRSIFLQGLLLMDASSRPPFFNQWSALWDRWNTWLHAMSVDPVTACLQFVLAQPSIDRVVVGVEDVRQLKALLTAVNRPSALPPAELMSDDDDLINPTRWR
jgi:aryl-alcohol dehydrogenase-like predicted oxidoreductase